MVASFSCKRTLQHRKLLGASRDYTVTFHCLLQDVAIDSGKWTEVVRGNSVDHRANSPHNSTYIATRRDAVIMRDSLTRYSAHALKLTDACSLPRLRIPNGCHARQPQFARLTSPHITNSSGPAGSMLQLVFHDGSVLALSPQQPVTLGRGRPASWQNPYISRAHIKLQMMASYVDQVYGSSRGGDGGSNGAAEAGAGGSGAGGTGQRMQPHRTGAVSNDDGVGHEINLGAVVEILATGQNKEYGVLVEQQQAQGECCAIAPQRRVTNAGSAPGTTY